MRETKTFGTNIVTSHKLPVSNNDYDINSEQKRYLDISSHFKHMFRAHVIGRSFARHKQI